jgi:hypothetical protein
LTTIQMLRDFLLWSAILNYAVLLGWFLAFTCAHQALYRLLGRWFRLSEEQFDSVHYAAMFAYKIAILSLNVVPYIALRIATSHGY